ncbi:hypothetical protein MIND_01236400 [Mycena indigotica]|uniref:Uncharacterized protein n=1 Tax=Mycena indigotica TaxID=2126181 RepID=A0A8H6S392_9AGAR|nr:uncharacterized protein MIND_01236400 [Mycena indigotica]KAF7292099.1 hypothetical protein MIND_01236400 [Mycena indigotica]
MEAAGGFVDELLAGLPPFRRLFSHVLGSSHPSAESLVPRLLSLTLAIAGAALRCPSVHVAALASSSLFPPTDALRCRQRGHRRLLEAPLSSSSSPSLPLPVGGWRSSKLLPASSTSFSLPMVWSLFPSAGQRSWNAVVDVESWTLEPCFADASRVSTQRAGQRPSSAVVNVDPVMRRRRPSRRFRPKSWRKSAIVAGVDAISEARFSPRCLHAPFAVAFPLTVGPLCRFPPLKLGHCADFFCAGAAVLAGAFLRLAVRIHGSPKREFAVNGLAGTAIIGDVTATDGLCGWTCAVGAGGGLGGFGPPRGLLLPVYAESVECNRGSGARRAAPASSRVLRILSTPRFPPELEQQIFEAVALLYPENIRRVGANDARTIAHSVISFLLSFSLSLPPAAEPPLDLSSAIQAVNIHILAGTPPNPLNGNFDDEKCSPAQVTAIRNGIVDARNMATGAIALLKPKDMNKSNGFFWIFGGSTVDPAIITKHFSFVLRLGTADEITSTKKYENSKTDLIFTCIPPTAPKATSAYANTQNIGRQKSVLNLIRLSPTGLANTESYTVAAARVKASGQIQDGFPVKQVGTLSVPAPPLAFTIVHEVQHADPLMDNPATDHLVDEKGGTGARAYGFQQIMHELSKDQKARNPQNYAFFGLLAASNPELFVPNCYIGDAPLSLAPLLIAGRLRMQTPLGPDTCHTTVPGACAACKKIIKGIPGDVKLPNFDPDST